jgi:hypothetical protein
LLGNSSPPHSDVLAGDTGHLVVDGRNVPVEARTAPTMGSGCHGSVLACARRCKKIVDFFLVGARGGGSAMIHPADAIVRAGCVRGGVLQSGGGSFGVDDGLLPCEGDTRCQLHRRGGGKMAKQVDFCV